MTQQERDEELRNLKQRLSTARENWSASLSKLNRYGNTMAEVGGNLKMLRSDSSIRESGISIPDDLPTTAEIKRLLRELADSVKEMNECEKLMRAFGNPVLCG